MRRVWLLHKLYPIVPTVMRNVLLNVSLFLESKILKNAYCFYGCMLTQWNLGTSRQSVNIGHMNNTSKHSCNNNKVNQLPNSWYFWNSSLCPEFLNFTVLLSMQSVMYFTVLVVPHWSYTHSLVCFGSCILADSFGGNFSPCIIA